VGVPCFAHSIVEANLVAEEEGADRRELGVVISESAKDDVERLETSGRD